MSPLPSQQGPLPLITPELSGIGGVLKARPDHFVVEEIPLYLPEGQGSHMFLRLAREGMTTRQVADDLAGLFGLGRGEVGFAGLKDRQARATQYFSLPLSGLTPEQAGKRVSDELGLEVLEAAWHANKLKTGHLLGNRFTLLVSEVGPEALEPARAVAAALGERGLANFYGSQRFGREGDNAAQGRAALLGRGPRDKWLRKLLLSAWQASLYNTWLTRRLARGEFARLIGGDLAKKTDTGGMFTVEDVATEQPRLDSGALTYTGPMFGKKMRWPGEPAASYEREILSEEEVAETDLKKARLMGSRRAARLSLDDLAIEAAPEGLRFSFSLPKGSYATVVMREFMKNEPGLPDGD
ncbi:MAG: tRNA pseudouridine(13) synthase TruD [Desulfarculaceae bacterium]|nr:tRNA pseudouridine(13) synthase TruD [Desulfarculaceae bacterium]MCF8071377.1 tRNA pseudouridine(13) synthase TruD [Desulfarculaceae bacterium]MCF8101702.1 tRNA pseudouridine(13) synthase TruD [Desulfarculaceae bacterium]MCF8116689.1 tRNA pseudouridine(13) synthase TruD [Desulfarculaceae bacterium]